jgi:hypothetical protein
MSDDEKHDPYDCSWMTDEMIERMLQLPVSEITGFDIRAPRSSDGFYRILELPVKVWRRAAQWIGLVDTH